MKNRTKVRKGKILENPDKFWKYSNNSEKVGKILDNLQKTGESLENQENKWKFWKTNLKKQRGD